MGGRKVDEPTAEWRERNPLRRWRREHSKTAADVAGEAQIAFASIGLWEAGGRTPSDVAYAALSAVMDRDEDSLRRAWSRWLAQRPGTAAAA